MNSLPNEPAEPISPNSRLSGIYIGHTVDCQETHCKTIKDIPKGQWDPTGIWASRVGKTYEVTECVTSYSLVQMLPEGWEDDLQNNDMFFAYRSHVRMLP